MRLTLASALALGALLGPGVPGATEPKATAKAAPRTPDEGEAELRRWEALMARLEKAEAAHDTRALARIDGEVDAELIQERKESEEELRRLLEEVRRDARSEPGVARRRAAEEHHERADRIRLEAIIAEWNGLRGRYAPADLARRRVLLAELIAQGRREQAGGKAAPEEEPGR
jgi:hypothetical protein